MSWRNLALMLLASRKCRSPAQGTTTINITLFLITLPRASKSHDVFKLANFCHIANRLEAYNTQTALTQCCNCQQFGHIWGNSKQPPRCMWWGGVTCIRSARKGQYSVDTDMPPQKVGGRRGTSSLQLSRLQARQGQDAKEKAAESVQDYKGRVLSSSHTTPGLQVSFAAVLRSNTQQHQQPQPPQVAQACSHSLEAQPTSAKSVSSGS
jgi:hypothetical protein